MSELPAHLEAIVADVRSATRTAVDRSRRRHQRIRIGAAALAVAVVGASVAGAAGVDYVGLVDRALPGAQVTDLSDRQQRVVASLGGERADVVVTDLGLTAAARTAPAGTSICDWVAETESLACSGAAGSSGSAAVQIPAGTRVYRIVPGASATVRPPERTVLYVPDLRLQLIAEP